MFIPGNNEPSSVFENHFSIKCPTCGTHANVSAVSIPRFEYLIRFRPKKVGIAYRCDSCNSPVFFRFVADYANVSNHYVEISDEFEEVERPQETYEFKYLPPSVAEDFREALTCYSHSCFNAFAAICRRTLQSTFAELGAEGKDRVQQQLQEVKKTAAIDEETYEILQQILIAGHDGAHPYLPKLSPERAGILLELMKDVLYQLFVRKAKIQESVELRKQAINQAKG